MLEFLHIYVKTNISYAYQIGAKPYFSDGLLEDVVVQQHKNPPFFFDKLLLGKGGFEFSLDSSYTPAEFDQLVFCDDDDI